MPASGYFIAMLRSALGDGEPVTAQKAELAELEKEQPFIRKNLKADLEAKKEAVRLRKK